MPGGRVRLGRSPILGCGGVIPAALKVGRIARFCACDGGAAVAAGKVFCGHQGLLFVSVGQIVGVVHPCFIS
jgi:hypothetical protein